MDKQKRLAPSRITLERLSAIIDNIERSYYWEDLATDAERAEINKAWRHMPGHYSFYDAVKRLFFTAGHNAERDYKIRAYKGDHYEDAIIHVQRLSSIDLAVEARGYSAKKGFTYTVLEAIQ